MPFPKTKFSRDPTKRDHVGEASASTQHVKLSDEMDTFEFAGLPFSRVDRPTAAANLFHLAIAETASFVCVTGAHGVVEARYNKAFRDILCAAAMVMPDGQPTVRIAQLRGIQDISRVTGWELMLDVAEFDSTNVLNHFFFGATQEVTDGLKHVLSIRYPDITIAGVINPPFREPTIEDIEDLAGRIIQSRANIIWIGLSTPRQERLAAALVPRLPAGVIAAVGAGFDFVAGTKPIAPRWVSVLCLEWLYRLANEPRRLWRRYFYIVPQFIWIAACDSIRVRRRIPSRRQRG